MNEQHFYLLLHFLVAKVVDNKLQCRDCVVGRLTVCTTTSLRVKKNNVVLVVTKHKFKCSIFSDNICIFRQFCRNRDDDIVNREQEEFI